MELRNLILAVVLSTAVGATSAWYITKKTATSYEDDLHSCLAREASFCSGNDLGEGLRMNIVTCNGEQELCLCGNPSILGGFKK